jgi:hypothetical protein
LAEENPSQMEKFTEGSKYEEQLRKQEVGDE